MDSLEIHKSLQQEIKSQKHSIVRDVKSRRSGKGGAGRVLFPSDYLSKEEKKLYRQAGEVKVYSMFDTILKMADFKKLPPEQQVRHMVEYRKRFNGKEIADGMGIKVGSYYGIVSALGIGKKYKPSATKANKAPKVEKAQQEITLQEPAQPAEIVQTVIYKPEGIVFGYGGIKKADEIIKRLSKLELLLDGEESLFDIEIKIKEVTQ